MVTLCFSIHLNIIQNIPFLMAAASYMTFKGVVNKLTSLRFDVVIPVYRSNNNLPLCQHAIILSPGYRSKILDALRVHSL